MTEDKSILRCPVCGRALEKDASGLRCENNHCFDRAKEGYVNLLTGQKPGDSRGDSREMARSRHEFLRSGAYAPLADAVGDLLERYCPAKGTVLDICCGEGDYTERILRRFPDRCYYGFDLSREMIRFAAKRKCGAEFFVANLATIPFMDGTVDFGFHLFAPFHAGEFSRILSRGGTLVTAIPGREHLFGLKEVLYDRPYQNDEKPPETDGFIVIDRVRVRTELTLSDPVQITALLQMTPYYYHTPSAGLARLSRLNTLTTPLDFVLYVLKK